MPTPPDLSRQPLRIVFGARPMAPSNDVVGFHVDVPVLAGFPEEQIFPPVSVEKEEPNCALFRSADLLIGCASDSIETSDLEACTTRLYQRILAATKDLSLYRIWNYVPRINAVVNGLEHYRSFCRARSLTFENSFGVDYKQRLPSASAVGCDGKRLTVIFAAGQAQPTHLENPEQLPAYEYPEEHGPRAPSFSRATRVKSDGGEYLFISGTSAIKGHTTVAPGSLSEQIACTLDNLKLVSGASGIGENLGAKNGWRRSFKVYLRRAEDLLNARGLLEGTLLQANDRVTWLRSDICRSALHIEIEATLFRPADAGLRKKDE